MLENFCVLYSLKKSEIQERLFGVNAYVGEIDKGSSKFAEKQDPHIISFIQSDATPQAPRKLSQLRELPSQNLGNFPYALVKVHRNTHRESIPANYWPPPPPLFFGVSCIFKEQTDQKYNCLNLSA